MISEDSLTRDFKKILLICFGGMGDVILFYPVIKVLRDLYPKSQIIFVVEPRCKSVAEKNPYVNRVITFDLKNKPELKDYLALIKDLRKENLDLAISMGSSFMVPVLLFLSGAKHRVGYATNKLKFLYSKAVPLNKNQYAAKMYFDLLKGVGIDADMLNPVPEIKIPESDMKWANEWFASHGLIARGSQKIVLVHPGASKLSKQKNIIKTWEPIKWTKLIDELLKKNIKVILAGGPDDEEDVNFIRKHIKDPGNDFVDAFGETKNLDQLGALIKHCDLLVCVDSAPMNVGVGIDVPLVAIFGPTNEKKILPPDEKFMAVRINLDCTPCLWDNRQTTCEALTCLKNLDVDTVLKPVFQQLGVTSEIKC
jgi:lipopolysaccharide heptosyltransferase II